MPRYHYEAIDAEGVPQEGDMEGASPEVLADTLQKRGFIVLNIGQAAASKHDTPLSSSKSAAESKDSSPSAKGGAGGMSQLLKADLFGKKLASGKVKLANLLLFTNQLASMIGAGLHLLKSLSSLAEDSSDKTLQAIIQEVRQDVERGESFSSALGKHPKTFGTIYVNLVRAAEATGGLDVVLDQLAIYLDKTLTLRRKVKGAMTYPLCILSFAMIAVIILIVKIVPSFEKTFSKLGAELPAATKMLIATSDLIRNYFFMVFLSLVGIGFVLWRLCKTERGSFIWDSIIIKIPLFGPLIWKSVLTRFLRTLSILLDSGVSVLEAFQLAGQAAGNKVVEKAVASCVDDIKEGKPINKAMATCNIFPNMVIRMVASGEEAGTVPEMLRKITVYYEQQVETAVESLSSLIEPVLILILGVVVGSIIVAIFLPIFKLGEAVKGAR